MTRWLWLLAGLAACSPKAAPAAEQGSGEPVLALPSVEMGSDFPLGDGTCRAVSARLRLSERRSAAKGRPADDVMVLRVGFECTPKGGAATLLSGASARLFGQGPEPLAPSTNTRQPTAPEVSALVFEVDARQLGDAPRLQLHTGGKGAELRIVLDPLTRKDGRSGGDGACERRRGELEQWAGRAFRSTRSSETCNVLGLLVPGPCREVEPELKTAALSHGLRCTVGRGLARGGLVPEDLHITLRRGRGKHALDRRARYTVSLFAKSGAVVFHGKHWVQALGRSDGRTHPELLAGLWQRVRAMDFFDRRGRWPDEDVDCDPGSDRPGNLITVRGAGRERMVVDRTACRAPFEAPELEELARHIEALAAVEAWTTPAPLYADPAAQVWTVSGE